MPTVLGRDTTIQIDKVIVMLSDEQFLLAKIVEECAEVQHIALKAMQFGLDEQHPELDHNNLERLRFELTDLLNTIEIFDRRFDRCLQPLQPPGSLEAKAAKLKKYKEYSHTLGMVKYPDL
jgi:hypothetical protein